MVRVAFVIGEYPGGENNRREQVALSYANSEVEVGIIKAPVTPYFHGMTQTEMTIDTATGQVTVVSTDDKGKTKREMEQMKLPPDLYNGMMAVAVKPGGESASPRAWRALTIR